MMTKTAWVIEQAGSPNGVCSADVQARFDCDAIRANTLLMCAMRNGDLLRARGHASGHASRFHYFQSAYDRDTWLQAQAVLRDQATVRRREQVVASERARAARRVAAVRPEVPPPQARSVFTISKRAATAAAAKAFTEAKPYVPEGVQPTVYARPTQRDRVDLMADPLPGVPGWSGGPVIRSGALDYQRHQRTQQQEA